jgi:hypothetical protein
MVTLARAELARGVREQPLGSNTSPDIARYRSALTPRPRGGPWCAYFTSYLAEQAGAPLGPDGDGIPNVTGIYRWALHTHRLTSAARPGELILYRGLGHVGVVETVDGPAIGAIDGNWSNRVRRHSVRRAEALAFVRVHPDFYLQGRELRIGG